MSSLDAIFERAFGRGECAWCGVSCENSGPRNKQDELFCGKAHRNAAARARREERLLCFDETSRRECVGRGNQKSGSVPWGITYQDDHYITYRHQGESLRLCTVREYSGVEGARCRDSPVLPNEGRGELESLT